MDELPEPVEGTLKRLNVEWDARACRRQCGVMDELPEPVEGNVERWGIVRTPN
ncbi:MAG: hypothetical protein GFH27_549283n232 [Chloroflexi bacterium AL-W]|nr:hypothetical protein [Chloroflexi bacterium AL-W]NOK86866.1 hypothetical protein [Chloroflexi bacterium AL-N15]